MPDGTPPSYAGWVTGDSDWRGRAAIVAGSPAAAGVITLALGGGWAEWVFASALLAALATVVLRCATAWREALTARSAARELARLAPGDAARAAVVAERRRLMGEITLEVRALLQDVSSLARDGGGAADPSAAARRIHARAGEATSVLRRQLGLLHDAELSAPQEPVPTPPEHATPARTDLVVAGAVTLLALVETVLWSVLDGAPAHPSSVVLTALAAATVVGRRTWTTSAAAACAGFFLLGLVFTTPVRPALWFLATVGGLLWTLASRATRSTEVAAGALLVGAVVLDVALVEPDNLPIDVVAMGVAVAGGLVQRAGQSHLTRHRGAAAARTVELEGARRRAVEAERATVARELHDTISHAVGLIAVQSAAAQVAWERDPDTTRGCLALVHATAEGAITELDALPGAGVGANAPTDLAALVERIRAAGTPVAVDIQAIPAPQLAEVVYRVAQESLTNVVRHAPGASALLRVVEHDGVVRVEVSDDGPGVADGVERGYGLVGLAERVGNAGGTVTFRCVDSGGWRVVAELPLVREPVG